MELEAALSELQFAAAAIPQLIQQLSMSVLSPDGSEPLSQHLLAAAADAAAMQQHLMDAHNIVADMNADTRK